MNLAFLAAIPALVATSLSLLAGPATARPVPPPAPTTDCSTANASIGGVFASACLYFAPQSNDSETLLDSAAVGGFTGITGWDGQWKQDARAGGTDLGAEGELQLWLTGFSAGDGTARLDWAGGPATADLALIVKAASAFHAYFFDDLQFAPVDGSYGVSYVVDIFNANDVRQGLSHLSLYTANATPCAPTDPACGFGITRVPTPAPLALIGAGLVGLALRSRRRARR